MTTTEDVYLHVNIERPQSFDDVVEVCRAWHAMLASGTPAAHTIWSIWDAYLQDWCRQVDLPIDTMPHEDRWAIRDAIVMHVVHNKYRRLP